MFLCTSRFDLQDDSFKFLEEYLTPDEIEAGKEEELEPTPDQFELNPLSDDDEQGAQDDDQSDVPYIASTQIRRASGRPSKRPRQEDDQ
jgi:hypothetical protein